MLKFQARFKNIRQINTPLQAYKKHNIPDSSTAPSLDDRFDDTLLFLAGFELKEKNYKKHN